MTQQKEMTQAIATRSTQLAFTIKEEMSLTSVADVFVKSGLFADTKTQAVAMVKVLAGREMGMEPVQAMMELYIVHGRIGMYAEAMSAKVKASYGYRYKVLEHTDEVCSIMFLERVDDGWEECGPASTFTAAEAKAAGTQNMQKFPRNMLFARAMANGFKWYCPDLKIAGLMATEELDGLPPMHTPPAPTAGETEDLQAMLTAGKAVAQAPPEEPEEPADAPEPDPEDQPDPEPTAAEPPQDDSEAGGGEPEPDRPAADPQGGADEGPIAGVPGETPPPPVDEFVTGYQEWLNQAKAYRIQLGETDYYATLGTHNIAKANEARPQDVDRVLRSLQKAAEAKANREGTRAPSQGSLAKAQDLRKAEAVDGIDELEKKLAQQNGGTMPDREAYGIKANLVDNKVAQLRVYFALLCDDLGGVDQVEDEPATLF